MPYDCFISYASTDLRFAEELHHRLVAEGFTVWFDKARLQAGYDWHKEIEQGCGNSRVLLPVLTPHWKQSEWTRYETYGAESIIPLLFEGKFEDVTTPPLRRFQAQAMDMTDAVGSDWPRLLAAIRELRDQPLPGEKTSHLAHIRYSANPYFVGRDVQLNEIHEQLFRNPTTALTQGHIHAITALGGVGKTTLAREYAEKFWRCYRQMFWVRCRIGIIAEYAKLFSIIFPERANFDLKDEEKAGQVLSELKQSDAPLRLLILDDASDEDSINEWLPKTGNCHTIITSRFKDWSSGVARFPVWILDKEPARELLLKRSGRDWDALNNDERIACDEVAFKLGYLPLALEQAAAYIEVQGPRFGFRAYMKLYAKAEYERQLLADKTSEGTTEYPDAVFTTWLTTIDKLSPGARAILRLAAFMAPTPIPFAMFIKGISIVFEQTRVFEPAPNSVAPSPNELNLRKWKSDLARYSMIRVDDTMVEEKDGEFFSIHGLVQTVERLNEKDVERREGLGRSVRLFNEYAPEASWRPESRAVWNELLPHAESLSEREHEETGYIPTADLLDHLSDAYAARGWYGRAIPPCRETWQLLRDSLGEEHERTLKAQHSLGFWLIQNGDWDESEKVIREVYRSRERVLGPEHHETWGTLHNLSMVMYYKGQFKEAADLVKQVRNGYEAVLGRDHRDTLTAIQDLANSLYELGDHTVAEALYREALDGYERALGNDHIDTLRTVAGLGLLLARNGAYEEAESLSRRALAGFDRVLGKDHPSTLWSVSSLAWLLNSKGDYKSAEPFYHRAMEGQERVLGKDHPDTIKSVENLAVLLESKRDYAGAESLYRRALEVRERVLGKDHPDTLMSVNNLAWMFNSKGDYKSAESLYHRALEGQERVIGREHPDFAVSLNNFALLLRDIGKLNEAESHLRCALAIDEKARGPSDMKIPHRLANLCTTLVMQDKLEESRQHLSRAWLIKQGDHDITSARILFVRLAVAFLESQSAGHFIGQLKVLISGNTLGTKVNIVRVWDIDPFLANLRAKLVPEITDFLEALVRALNDRSQVSTLDDFGLWRNQSFVSLDAPWV